MQIETQIWKRGQGLRLLFLFGNCRMPSKKGGYWPHSTALHGPAVASSSLPLHAPPTSTQSFGLERPVARDSPAGGYQHCRSWCVLGKSKGNTLLRCSLHHGSQMSLHLGNGCWLHHIPWHMADGKPPLPSSPRRKIQKRP